MLKLKHSHHISLPHLSLAGGSMQLSPVPSDDDELTKAIESDSATGDNTWELNERPDVNDLTAFWSEVVEDVSKDPNWFRFENE
jgi:hypothetical protein